MARPVSITHRKVRAFDGPFISSVRIVEPIDLHDTLTDEFPDFEDPCPDALPPGTRIDDYEIGRCIGQGSFGTVYRAEHAVTQQRAAVKILDRSRSADRSAVARFLREAATAGEVRHPNVIEVYGFGRLGDGRHYYVMEFLEGETLEERLRWAGRLSIDEALAVFEPLAAAIDAVHLCGIVHRDLKPANIFLAGAQSPRPTPKLLDFGIAKLLRQDPENTIETRAGSWIGTPPYMSPEQCGGFPVGPSSDVYSLGIMAYETLVGHRPFARDSVGATLEAHILDPAPDPRLFRSDLSEGVVRALNAMLAKRPEDRPPTAAAAVAALREA